MKAIIEIDGWQKIEEIYEYNMRARIVDRMQTSLPKLIIDADAEPTNKTVPLYRFYYNGKVERGLPVFEFGN